MPNYYQELPESVLVNPPTLIRPDSPTPHHTLYLSNLDDHSFLRFNIKYIFLFRSSPDVSSLRSSLSSILVHYYPLAGRVRPEDDHARSDSASKLVVECTGDGALFAEAVMDATSDDFLRLSRWPNPSWRTLLYRPPGVAFLSLPILLVQATHLRCGGMILCVGVSHCLCDGIGTAQFMNAWADVCRGPTSPISVPPCWGREALRPRVPLQVQFSHPEFEHPYSNRPKPRPNGPSEPLVPVSITFGPETILYLKRLCVPSIKCTSFEVLAAHVWRCWARAMSRKAVKLLFTADIRSKVDPPLPKGYYGNAIVLGCAECDSETLAHGNISQAVKAVQAAKATTLSDDHVRSAVDLLEERRAGVDLSCSLVVTQWSRLGLDRVDFGSGRPDHVGPISSEVHCVFLPVVGQPESVTVLVSMPKSRSHRFECYMRDPIGGGGMEGPIELSLPSCPLYPVEI